MAVVASFDWPNRRIYMAVADWHPVDVYREMREDRRLNETSRRYDPMCKYSGYEAKGGGRFTPRFMTLLSGAKIVPVDAPVNPITNIQGEILTDDQTVAVDTSSLTGIVLVNYAPAEAEVIEVVTGSAVTAQDKLDIAGAVWEEAEADHAVTGTMGARQSHIKYQESWLVFDNTAAAGGDGSNEAPFNDFAACIAAGNATGIKRVLLRGNGAWAPTPVDLSGFEFVGDSVLGAGIVTVDPVSTGEVRYTDMAVINQGAKNTTYALDCVYTGFAPFYGKGLQLQGTLALRSNTHCVGTQVVSGQDLDCTLANYESHLMATRGGVLTVTNLTTATATVTIDMDGCGVVVDASCTGGTVIITGVGRLEDNSAGTTVIDNRLAVSVAEGDQAAIADKVWAYNGPP